MELGQTIIEKNNSEENHKSYQNSKHIHYAQTYVYDVNHIMYVDIF